MNRQQAACLAACAAVLLVAGVIDKATQRQPSVRPAPTPAPTVTAAVWLQRLDDARTALESTTTAIRGVAVTGQNLAGHQHNCHAAVASYNQAASHLHENPLNPSTECQP